MNMNQAQQLFEAIMRGKGYADLSQTSSGKYRVAAVQMRWNYFRMGWEMKAVTP